MAIQSLEPCNSNYQITAEEEKIPFVFTSQMSSSDFRNFYFSSECQRAFLMQERILDCSPPVESFPIDSISPSLHIIDNCPFGIEEDSLYNYGSKVEVWSELCPLFAPKRSLLLCNNGDSSKKDLTEERKMSRKRLTDDQDINNNIKNKNNNNTISKMLTRQTISNYFYMPIMQAAKELNVGLTLLKKRCRELGIQRWPHRKLMSLQTLIKNVQELGKVAGDGREEKLREAIHVLERERKLLEESPDMQLENKTKRLRQACFKANYKKRKLMIMMMEREPNTTNSCSHASFDASLDCNENETIEDDEIRSLLSNF